MKSHLPVFRHLHDLVAVRCGVESTAFDDEEIAATDGASPEFEGLVVIDADESIA